MLARTLFAATVLLMLAHPAMAQEPLATYKSLSPELALDLARQRLAIADHAGTRSPSRSSIASGGLR